MVFRRFIARMPLTAWLILLITLATSAQAYIWMRDFLVQRDHEQQEFAATQLTLKLHERLRSFRLVLTAGTGVFAATNEVTREDWKQFVDTLRASGDLKNVQGIGFSSVLRPDELISHENLMRSEGFDNYSVTPEGKRDVYSAIVFLEPFDARNQRAHGYDMFSEPVRRAAMIQARDTGLAALTGKVTLVQETEIDPQPGTLMYVPVYRHGASLQTPELRRANLLGWVYSPFRMNDLLDGIIEGWGRDSGIRRAIGVYVYDDHVAPDNLLFTDLPETSSTQGLRRELDFNGHKWVLEFVPRDSASGPSLLIAWLVGAGLLLVGILILSLYLTLTRTQEKAQKIAKRLTRDLRELSTRFDTVASRVPGLMYSFKLYPDGRSCFPYASQGIRDVFGLYPEDVQQSSAPALKLLHPEDSERIRVSIMESAQTLSVWQEEYRVIHSDGRLHWVIGNAIPQAQKDGSIIWYGSMARITERKKTELRLKQALIESSRFRDALNRMTTFVYMKDSNLKYTYANQTALLKMGVSLDDLIGTRGEQAFDQASLDRIEKADARVLCGERITEELELTIQGKPGTFLQIKTPMYEDENSNKIVGLIGITTDVTQAKEQAREIERLAHYDPLTGLPNRSLLSDRLEQAMAMVERRKNTLAVVYLDLDGFKAVNDTYGHDAGDHVLVTVAQRMKRSIRKEDTLARLGGDEFVAILIDMSPDGNYEQSLKKLLSAASQPVLLNNNLAQVSASLGVTFYPQQDITVSDQLLRQADQAMYLAKVAGKNRFHLFDAEQDRTIRSQHETIERIRHALHNDELCLYYQPKVNMRTSEIIGAEALIRWQHPERGLLAPGAFISLIENTPVMLEVGFWVIDTALRAMSKWQKQGLRIPVSVNISATELRDPGFVARLKNLLSAWPDLAPSMLQLEILETAALGDLVKVSNVLNECRALGVSIAIDDFGTGYSSLTYFKRLPAEVVKIDQSFVSGILRDPADLTILDGIIRLADALKRELIAEGVETHQHAEMLLRIGCGLGQGYGIAKPMCEDALAPWCKQWRAPSSWANVKPVPRKALPALYACVDHRAWVEHFRNYLQGNRQPLDMNPHNCRFGIWLDAQPADMSELTSIRTLHTQIHECATDIDELNKKDQRELVPELMKTLIQLSNQLSERMQVIMESME
ncbi:EAL domain-containing protein [Marinobacter sp.]|uniref:EAL domain-containing protein n=1 Tax=Marinobacter sp. TaxID=50741 RepID=UPI0035680320